MHKKLQNNLQALMQKDMDRKDFLVHVGIGMAAVTGAATLVKTISDLSSRGAAKSDVGNVAGYGASAYGGVSDRTPSKTRK